MSRFQQYQATFTAHLRNPDQNAKPDKTSARRMAIYREIVFNNFLASVSACFPVLQSIVGKRRFKKWVRACFATQAFHSPFFRDIPKAFAEFLQSLDLSATDLPVFAAQLAHYEWVELEMACQRAIDTPHAKTDITSAAMLGSQTLQLPAAHRLLYYDYAVHQLSKTRANAVRCPTFLLVYRTPDFQVRFIQLNAASYQLLTLIQANAFTTLNHLDALAETALTHVSQEQVRIFGLETLYSLYLEQALFLNNA